MRFSYNTRIHYIIISSIELKEYRRYYKGRIIYLKKSVIMTSFRIKPWDGKAWEYLKKIKSKCVIQNTNVIIEPILAFSSETLRYLVIYTLKRVQKEIHACFCISCAKILLVLERKRSLKHFSLNILQSKHTQSVQNKRQKLEQHLKYSYLTLYISTVRMSQNAPTVKKSCSPGKK